MQCMSIIKGCNLYSLEVYFQFCFVHVHTQYAEGFVNLKEPHIYLREKYESMIYNNYHTKHYICRYINQSNHFEVYC